MKRICKFVFLILMLVINIGICLAFDFEKNIKGSTGWATINLSIRESANDSSNILGTVNSGDAFLIMSEEGDYWKVKYNGVIGYVNHNYCMINLPDIIPSIKYNISNASSSIYRSSNVDIPDITGTRLYSVGKVMNYKIGREEYIVPSLYSTAKMIYNGQVRALNDGYSLMIYDSYRPRSVSTLIANKLNILYQNNATVKDKIDYSTGLDGTRYFWGQSWFLAQSLSTHNVGSAIDVTLFDLNSNSEVVMPTLMHELSTDAIKYYSGNVSKISDNYSVGMLNNEYARKLDGYMTGAGMQTLASEWWHFQDKSGYERIANSTNWNGCDFQVDHIVSEPDLSFSIVSDKYTIGDSYIYTGYDVNPESIVSNISITGDSSSYLSGIVDNGKFKVMFNNEVVKEYDILNYSSSVFDLSLTYLLGDYSYIRDNISLNNLEIGLNVYSNKIEIKYNDIVFASYDFVNYSSNIYDMSGSSIKVNDSDISSFLGKFSCTGCSVYVYDGLNNLTEGLFHDNYSLNIMYGSTLIKSFDLTYSVTGVSLNTHSVSINLGNGYQLIATVNPSGASNKSVTYSSSNTGVVSVDQNGYVNSVGVGEADITVTTSEGNFTDTCHVVVSSIPTYTVTFKDGDSVYTSEYVEGVSVVFKSDLSRPGYTLTGWSYDGSVYTFNDNLLMPNKNIELIAIWTKNAPVINNYIVSGNYLNGISLNTNISGFNLGIDSIYDVKFYTNKGVLKTSGLVSTGDYVKIYLDNSLVSEYQIVIKGDINGDGKNNAHDISRLYKHIRGRISMDECFVRAADVNGDSNANAHDISKMYRYIRGRISHL